MFADLDRIRRKRDEVEKIVQGDKEKGKGGEISKEDRKEMERLKKEKDRLEM